MAAAQIKGITVNEAVDKLNSLIREAQGAKEV